MLFHARRDSATFEAMVHAHSGDLYRFAYWLCRNRAQAEDLVQETYSRAWSSWNNVRDEKAAKGWLLTILHHEHARLYEKKRPEMQEVAGPEPPEASVESRAESQYEMREALWALAEKYREPLLLQVLGGFSCAEIAASLSLTDAAVMQRLSRARKSLRAWLEAKGNTNGAKR